MFETTELNKFGFHLHDEKMKNTTHPFSTSSKAEMLKTVKIKYHLTYALLKKTIFIIILMFYH